MENKKRVLGRGLEDLFNSEAIDLDSVEAKIYETASNEEIIELNLSDLRPNPYQPRKIFDEEGLRELADSIREHGVFQPIIVKKSIKGYDIIAGERRFRASKMVGLEKIPAIIRDFTDEQMMEIALLENLQRENLSVIEEALAYKAMIEHLNLTQDELSRRVGKSRSHITNMLGLLNLPEEVKDMIIEDKISMSHARVLSKMDDKDEIIALANKIIDENLNVRDIENVSKNEDIKKTHKIKTKSNEEIEYIENLFCEKLGTKVKISSHKIDITYSNMTDLKRILDILKISE
jgi:ParB family chromosome partitioning protein